MDKSAQIPLWFELLLNSIFSAKPDMELSFTSWRIYIVVTWARRMVDGGQIGKIYRMTFVSLRLNPSVIWFAPGSASTRHPTNTSLRMSEDVLLRLPSALIEL